MYLSAPPVYIFAPDGDEGFFVVIRMQESTAKLLRAREYILRLRGYRNVAQNYTHRKEVKDYFLNKYNHRCVKCGSTENLEIDHIKPVSEFAWEMLPINRLNAESNLRVLCRRCNTAKTGGV